MDTILDNIPIEIFVSDIEENKPVEKPKKRKERRRADPPAPQSTRTHGIRTD